MSHNISYKGLESLHGKKWVTRLFLLSVLVTCILFGSLGNVVAQDNSPTDDEVNAISKQLYCPVCESIPLDACGTQACIQWQDTIREKLSAGWSEKEIKKYFDKQPKNSLISVEGAVKTINLDLSEDNQISETIIYNRLDDPKFNTNNLKGQSLDNQVSKTKLYDVKITKEFEEKVEKLKSPGIYLTIEDTQRKGSKILRLKTSKEHGNLNNSFPPNEDSLKKIKKLINEQKK